MTELPADQLAKFRARFEEFEAASFDERIERDAAAGKLDRLADEALADFRAGPRANCEAFRQFFFLGGLCEASG